MRKVLSCVLMMILLLCGCGANKADSPEAEAALIRAEYLGLERWSADVKLCADYGEQVFDFIVKCAWQREGDTVLTVTAPELIAGITARIRDGETLLEYDGAGVSLGMLDLSGLTPVSAIPALMAQITGGYMARCSWRGEGEQRELEILFRDPASAPQEGREFLLYFDPATHTPRRAEVSVGGVLRVRAEFDEFTMEMSDDEAGADADLG